MTAKPPPPSTRLKNSDHFWSAGVCHLANASRIDFPSSWFCCAVPFARTFQLIRYFAMTLSALQRPPPLGGAAVIVARVRRGCLCQRSSHVGGGTGSCIGHPGPFRRDRLLRPSSHLVERQNLISVGFDIS